MKPKKQHSWKIWHGVMGKEEWKLPKCVVESSEKNRPDQGSEATASEYLDHPEVLLEKMKMVAELLKKSKLCLVYTGAGISRQSGIPDYATKAKNSIMSAIKNLKDSHDAKPTRSHHCLTILQKAGLVQQNHDGLPQKAGFPQEMVNEIHGAWFDPSNPVVQFYGHLRDDLFRDMVRVENNCDLCLCMGTSLSGMNADRCVLTPCKTKFHFCVIFLAKNFSKGKKGSMGSIIINLQFTGGDKKGVWAKIDDALKVLLEILKLEYADQEPVEENDIISVPYDKNGKKLPEGSDKKKMIFNMSEGQKVNICHPNATDPGVVTGKDKEDHFMLEFKKPGKLTKRLRLGKWWMNCLKEGRIEQMPLVNVDPEFEK